ncbi:hypothetical protein CTI12_AA305920 [Artemisia annua]|uniref:Uncharacterized protein n=1 Tax=Artemisia annua TaxID=35608 RepID=A0A2U1N5C0_ARTAN|nr:hypothetical protein CTI12_AA305920 [Artemisia annua]
MTCKSWEFFEYRKLINVEVQGNMAITGVDQLGLNLEVHEETTKGNIDQTETTSPEDETTPIPPLQQATTEPEDKPVTQASKKANYDWHSTTGLITWSDSRVSVPACKIASIKPLGKTLAMFSKHDLGNTSATLIIWMTGSGAIFL